MNRFQWYGVDGSPNGGMSTSEGFFSEAPRPPVANQKGQAASQGATAAGAAAVAAGAGPVGWAVLGAGLLMGSIGKMKADAAQAEAERANARYYREQAAYMQEAGDRKQDLFNYDTKVLTGDQLSAFAKAGVDVSSSANWMAEAIYQRDQESLAIGKERDFNVRLANLRAQQSEQTAKDIQEASPYGVAGNVLSTVASFL
jgi:hypothetical protein